MNQTRLGSFIEAVVNTEAAAAGYRFERQNLDLLETDAQEAA